MQMVEERKTGRRYFDVFIYFIVIVIAYWNITEQGLNTI